MSNTFMVVGTVDNVMEMSDRFLIDIKHKHNDGTISIIPVTFRKRENCKLKASDMPVDSWIGAKGDIVRKQLTVGIELVADKITFMTASDKEGEE